MDEDEFHYEYKLAEVAGDIALFTHNGIVAELTPLLIAIQYRHIDIVRFILEKMRIDKRMSLALITVDKDPESE